MKFQFLKPVFYAVSICTVLASCEKEQTSLEEKVSMTEMTNERSGEKMVPFKGVYTTTVEVLSGPPLVYQRITGLGQASHLGSSKFVALPTLDVRTNQLSGTAIFYAANGDEFYTSFTGTATPIVNNIRTVNNYHTIIGGTGRFADASGTFTGITVVNLSSPTNTITYEGTINY